MYAEKIVVETDTTGHLKSLPILPPNKRFEIIFLDCDSNTPKKDVEIRQRHPEIIGKMQIVGDIVTSAPVKDWNLPS